MTFKNISLFCLTLVILAVTHSGRPFPLPDDDVVKIPSFEPPREFLLLVNNDAASPGPPESELSTQSTSIGGPAEPAQELSEKLSHTGPVEPDPLQNDLPVTPTAPDASLPVSQAPAQPSSSMPDAADGKDDIVVSPGGLSMSIPAPLTDSQPITGLPSVEPAVSTGIPDSAIIDLPTTVLTVTPTLHPTTSAAQFYSLSSNPYATFTSYRALATSSTKPTVPLPSQGPAGESIVAKQSRRNAVVGVLVAVGIVMSLVAFVFCFRCRGCRRKRSDKPLDLLAEDPERESLSPEKEKMFPVSSPTLGGYTLPVLRSHIPHTVTFEDPPDQQEWRLVTAGQRDYAEGELHVTSGDSFMEVDLGSHPNLYTVEDTHEDISAAPPSTRASAGASSTGGRSYSTRASAYSSTSAEQSGPPSRISASFDKLNQLASLASTPVVSAPRTRQRSRTFTSISRPAANALKPTKSLPSITSYENRFSNDSTRSRKTTCSRDSEWDVAQAYGASRFSKESAGGGSILSTISEATMESMEAVEVGGKQCVLMKGKF